jgi:hypothetical protein
MKENKIYIIALVLLFILVFLVSFTFFLKEKIMFEKSSTLIQHVTPAAPTSPPVHYHFTSSSLPKTVQKIPTVAPENGFGIDTNSLIVKNSEKEIAKLSKVLPYQKEFITQNGIPVSILINAPQLQNNTWTLVIQIYGIDYSVNQDMNAYVPNKTAFREAAATVFAWLKEKDVLTQNLIVQWGDKEFIENKAQEWLK